MSSVSNGLYFLTLPLVRVMRVIYRKIRHARYLYIKRNVEKVWGARYLSKNTVIKNIFRHMKKLYTSKNEGRAPRIFTFALCEGEWSTSCSGQPFVISCNEGWPPNTDHTTHLLVMYMTPFLTIPC